VLNKGKDLEGTELWRNQAIREDSRRLNLEVLLPVSRDRLEKNETGEKGEGVSQNGNHRCLRNEPPHECLFGLLESFCTSAVGIYHRYGRVVLAST
jgi:hypothetical protein